MHSISSIEDLPSLLQVQKTLQRLALLDAIFSQDYEGRYFSYNNNWDGKGQEMMGSMRDGSGEEFFIHISRVGIVGKTFSFEVSSDTTECLKEVPNSFAEFKNELAFSLENSSCFFWSETHSNKWNTTPKGLKEYPLLRFLTGGSLYYKNWAEEYYEIDIEEETLNVVFDTLSVTDSQIKKLNPELSLADLADDIAQIL